MTLSEVGLFPSFLVIRGVFTLFYGDAYTKIMGTLTVHVFRDKYLYRQRNIILGPCTCIQKKYIEMN